MSENENKVLVGYDPQTGQPIYQEANVQNTAAQNNGGNQGYAAYNQTAPTYDMNQNQYQQNSYGMNNNVNNQQAPYGQPAMNNNQKPKKNGVGLIIAIIVILFVLIAGLVVAAVTLFGKKDKKLTGEELQTIINNSFSSAEEDGIAEIFKTQNWSELYQNGCAYGGSMKIDTLEGKPADGNPEFSIDAKVDTTTSAFDMTMGGTISGISINGVEYYVDSNSMLVNIPVISDKAFELDYSGDLDAKLQKAPICSMLGVAPGEVSEAIGAMKSYMEAVQDSHKAQQEYREELLTIYDDLFTDTEVENLDKETLFIGDEEVECAGYRMKLDKEEAQKAIYDVRDAVKKYQDSCMTDELEAIMDKYGTTGTEKELENFDTLAEYTDEFYVDVYVHDDQAAKIDMKITSTTDEYLEITLTANGGNHIMDNFTCLFTDEEGKMITVVRTLDNTDSEYNTSFDFTVDDENIWFNFDYNKSDETFSTIAKYNNEEVFAANGKITSDESENGIEMEFDELKVTVDGTDELVCSGTIYVKPLEESVTKPDYETMDVLNMTQEEWYSVVMGAYSKFGGSGLYY